MLLAKHSNKKRNTTFLVVRTKLISTSVFSPKLPDTMHDSDTDRQIRSVSESTSMSVDSDIVSEANGTLFL